MSTPSTAHHLSEGALGHLGAPIATPAYDRSLLRRSIVHIGVGGFHRAHLATYVDELCRSGDRDWSIIGAGVLPGDARMAEVLSSQDHLYTLITRGTDETEVRVIGSIVDFVHAATDPEPLVGLIADPDTQIVSLTVTEGGYPIDDTTGAYAPTPATAGPGSAFGAIAAGLARRRDRDGGPLTILSCDNVIANGSTTRTATLGAAAEIDATLGGWIADNVTFPNSMVDRITPATTDADRHRLASDHGIADGWPVVTEPFRQWVVEDRFAGDRLPLEQLDVIVTDDVEPYELMKLRLLNAGHSCLAYLAALDGIDTVDGALADPAIRSFLQTFLDREARPTVPPVDGIDLDEYIASLVERFSNPNVGDQISRLCLDGTAKFPKFLIPTIEKQLAADGPIELAALALAGWCEYLRLGSSPDSSIELSPDPGLDRAVERAVASADDPAAFLELDLVFGPALRSGRFADCFRVALGRLRADGVASSIEAAIT